MLWKANDAPIFAYTISFWLEGLSKPSVELISIYSLTHNAFFFYYNAIISLSSFYTMGFTFIQVLSVQGAVVQSSWATYSMWEAHQHVGISLVSEGSGLDCDGKSENLNVNFSFLACPHSLSSTLQDIPISTTQKCCRHSAWHLWNLSSSLGWQGTVILSQTFLYQVLHETSLVTAGSPSLLGSREQWPLSTCTPHSGSGEELSTREDEHYPASFGVFHGPGNRKEEIIVIE